MGTASANVLSTYVRLAADDPGVSPIPSGIFRCHAFHKYFVPLNLRVKRKNRKA